MKICLVLMCTFSLGLSAATYAQQERITLSLKEVTLKVLLDEVQRQTQLHFMINRETAASMGLVSVEVNNETVENVLGRIFQHSPLTWSFMDGIIVVKERDNLSEQQTEHTIVEGLVTDSRKQPLPGVTVTIKGTTMGVTTDVDGKFKLELAGKKDVVLVFSFVGMETVERSYKGEEMMNIVMQESTTEIEEVVVQGVFQKKLSSYTGAAVTATSNEIKQVGSLNLLQALNAIDPSIRVNESLEFGSDPNRIPEITIRGENGFDLRSSSDADQMNPNAPLYILDGMEVSARQIYDMDMNRIESVTILKDASATALYGSRGANGVVLITTKRPKSGEIRTTFNADFNISAPDLRDYNLMNAREKLEFERLSGIWHSDIRSEQENLDKKYNERLKEVLRGVDTYWLSKPLRTGVNQRYSLYFEGGGSQFRYGLNLRYDSDQGVMKKSGRDRLGLDIYFNYNIGTKLYINNTVSMEEVKEKNSPYGSFSQYAQLNPCDRVYDEEGNMVKEFYPSMPNPLVNASLPNFNKGHHVMLQDNLSVDWWVVDGLHFRGNVAYTKETYKSEIYRSPASTEFIDVTEAGKRGTYTIDHSDSYNIDGNFTLQYSQNIAERHSLSAGVGANLQVNEADASGFTATGFASDDVAFVGAATQFAENSTPSASYDKAKLIGFFANLNYGYDNRYFIDASYRTDGSSKFGKDSRFAPFWSVGLAWNVHNEAFWGDNVAHTLKIRGSVGNTGSVNFSSEQALTTYYYDFSKEYNGIYGTSLYGYGNPGLKWQTTKNYNLGFDLTLFHNRLQCFVDFYTKTTDNLLLPYDVAPSVGFTSYIENIGRSRNKGWEGRFRIMWIDNKKHKINWSTTFAIFQNRNKIVRLSNTLQDLNEDALEAGNNRGPEVLRQYEEGRSQSALMVVRSAGIDPATGQEVFIKLDGTKTFDYDPTDKVIVGDVNPKAEGNVISNFNWGGFNLYLLFKYHWGAKQYNGTLATKVEGVNPYFNVDRRALEERWKEPGDDVFYRSIKQYASPYQTTRFVFDDNLFSLETISLSYDLPLKYAQKIRAERLKITASSTDVFRLSTIRQERGTSYPFARTFSIGLSATF